MAGLRALTWINEHRTIQRRICKTTSPLDTGRDLTSTRAWTGRALLRDWARLAKSARAARRAACPGSDPGCSPTLTFRRSAGSLIGISRD